MPKCSANTVDVRRDRRIAAEDAVDVAARETGVRDRKLRRLAHEIERGGTLVLAICRQPNAADEAHDGDRRPARFAFNTTRAISIRFRQAEHALGDKAEN